MALLVSTDNNIQNREIYKTLSMKLWLEDKMSSDLRSLFKKTSTGTAEHYAHTGNILDLHSFDIDMTALLRKWYRKTSDIFSKNIREGIKSDSDIFEIKADALENSTEDKKKINAEIAAALLLFIEQQSKKQTDLIMGTSKEIIEQSVNNIIREMQKDGLELNNRTIADAVRKEFNDRSISRSDLIAFQEVGMTASQSKKTEALVLNNTEGAILSVGTGIVTLTDSMRKNWNAVLDMVTRPAHAEADFRYKFSPIPINEKFIVGGEYLDYPRDPMGSPGQIIHCRCEELYIAKTL